MGWIYLIISDLVVWIASLCKIFSASLSPSATAYFIKGDSSRKKNVLLVIAHPDDESMFFAPSITYLTSRGHNVHILCLSIGNADGMGQTRKEELGKACDVLKVSAQHVKILDRPDLQDGFGKLWDPSLVARIVKEEIAAHHIDVVFTFDNYGISGHCNHRDVHNGIRKLLMDSRERSFEAWELVSTNIVRKYSGPIDIWLSIVLAMYYPNGEVHCILNEHPLTSFKAMAQHSSQWVWFRKLFVSFSSYTYVNTLQKITV